jgi:tRNA threonylcarbamoyladenosine biosynthesis protein TsaB
MRILAIETSGRLGSLALLESLEGQARVIAERGTPDGERTAQSLLPSLQDLLREHNWRPTDVELVCVSTGPGSFTGLRIGIVTAKTFAYATGAKLVGVHTLAAIAEGADGNSPRLWTVLDAQRQELFVASFTAGQDLAAEEAPATQILTVDAWLKLLAAGDAIAGPPLAKLKASLPSNVTLIDGAASHPMAAAVGRLGARLYERGIQTTPLELVPHYYRKSAAEEKSPLIHLAPGQ